MKQTKFWFQKLILFIATGFGLGKLPVAPGTFGSLAALPIIYLMDQLEIWQCSFYWICFILLSIWVADRAESIIQSKDPRVVVIDEMLGYCTAMTLVPVTIITLIIGFIGFRIFDILKPPPVKYFERCYSGGAGIILDDLMAGLLTALILKTIQIIGII